MCKKGCKEESYKIGDKVFVIKNNNGASIMDGTIVEVTLVTGNYITVKNEKSQSFNLFHGSSGCKSDEFHLATFEVKKKYLEDKIKKLQEELDFLIKYPTDELYLAHKLKVLFDAKDEKSMAEALTLMKKSNYL